MLKNISRLEIIIDKKSHQYTCEMDSSTEHVKEALFQFLKYVGQIEDAVKKQQEEIKKEEEIQNDQAG